MKKFITAGAAAAVAVLAAGCTSGNSGQAHSLQSEVTSLQREVSSLKQVIASDQELLTSAQQSTGQVYDNRMAALRKVDGQLKREQSLISKMKASGGH